MKIANIVLICLIVLLIAAFVIYRAQEIRAYEADLRNYPNPTAYIDSILQYSEEFELDPYLVVSIMRCESSFDPNAVSKKGAIGLMQIMPDTGAWIAHKLDLDDTYQQMQLYDPETNIRFSCWYLRFLTIRLEGDRTCIIAAYNAGHGSVEGWLENPAYSSNGTLHTIPFPETERYYSKVKTAYEKYQTLYPEMFGVQSAETPAA